MYKESPHLLSPTKLPSTATVFVFQCISYRSTCAHYFKWFPHISTQPWTKAFVVMLEAMGIHLGDNCSIARKTSFAVCVVSSWTSMWIIRVNLKGQVQSLLGSLGSSEAVFHGFSLSHAPSTSSCNSYLKCRSLHSRSMSWVRGRHSLEQRKTTCCRRDITIHVWSQWISMEIMEETC